MVGMIENNLYVIRVTMDSENKEPHPWGEFLKWRYRALLWSREKYGYSNEQLAHQFSMDERQVMLIMNMDHILRKDYEEV